MQKIKQLIFSIVLIFQLTITYAQEYHVRDGFGILIGGNFSNIIGRGVSVGNEPKLGLRTGFSLESTVMNSFYLRTELLYNQKGSRISAGIGQQSTITQTFHMVELPVLACFEFTKGFGIGGGIYSAYLIDATSESQFGSTSAPIQLIKSDLRKIELGYAVEINFFKSSGLQGGLRYQRSISTINQSIDRYHQVISAFFGFLFNNG